MEGPCMPEDSRVHDLIALINSLPLNIRLRLRDDAMPSATRREFIFKGFEKGKVLIAPEDEEYTYAANIEDIDWDGIPKMNGFPDK
jgi:hypothetical protein